MLQEAGLAHKRRGKLHIDTTQMPGGVLAFNVSTLAEKAAEALDSGIRFVELTMDNAREWGYSAPHRPLAEEAVDVSATASARGKTASRGGPPREHSRGEPDK